VETEAQDAHKPFVLNGRNGPAMALTFVVIALPFCCTAKLVASPVFCLEDTSMSRHPG